ncbi:hypothetical protein PVL30_003519 [Lodderomyces elongisporus]|uniref:uncharacterized protein n=1 Tax=Lodderomyces elongisporus TaxID=36914 RepID=UPI00291CF4A8|nr:uncharacterized protein PVL30_003519 [Lodderomyces elongisporus]WLF79755.1 hypothetical protein PVL30_003519 [Lodderomyces elongisporus]
MCMNYPKSKPITDLSVNSNETNIVDMGCATFKQSIDGHLVSAIRDETNHFVNDMDHQEITNGNGITGTNSSFAVDLEKQALKVKETVESGECGDNNNINNNNNNNKNNKDVAQCLSRESTGSLIGERICSSLVRCPEADKLGMTRWYGPSGVLQEVSKGATYWLVASLITS